MGNFYFGNIRKAGYYPAPSSGMGAASHGQFDQVDFVNGGSYVAQGAGTHREFAMEWRINDKTALSWLNDYRSGNYGTGLLYFIDPFALNPVPPHWGTPMLSGMGWPSLVGSGVQPTLAPTTYTRVNLVTNPSFEVDTAGWGTQGAPTLTRSTAQAHSGAASLQVVTTAAGTGPITNVNIKTGAVVTASAWVYSTAAAEVSVYLSWFAGATFLGDTSTVATLAAGWNRVSYSNSRATATIARFGLRSRVASQTFFVDDVLIENASDLYPYFPTTSPVPATQYDIPYQSATYSVTGAIGAAPARRLTMLIPPDGDLRIGFTGSATNAGIHLQLVNLDGSLTAPQVMPMLSAGDNQLTNIYLPGYLYKAAFFYLAPTAIGGGTVTLASVDARYGTGTSSDPIFGNYVSGDGHSGMRFAANVDMTYIRADSSGDKQVSAATSFTEVGSWL